MVGKSTVDASSDLEGAHDEQDIVIVGDEHEADDQAGDEAQGALDPHLAGEVVDSMTPPQAMPAVRNETRLVNAAEVVKKPTAKHSRVTIDNGLTVPDLDPFNPWEEARKADALLSQGIQPSVASAQSADIIILGKRNGMLLWIMLGEAVLVVLAVILVVRTALTMPARAIPPTAEAEIYKKTTQGSSQVKVFAKMFAANMETWSYWDTKSLPQRVLPYLDPELRGPFETRFTGIARESGIYKGRQFFELSALRYIGVSNDTEHKIILFYRVFSGRGEDEKTFAIDTVSRRAKILVIGEVDATAENEWGLQVIKHYDLTEAQYVESKGENPWDVAEGKPDSAKSKAKKKKKQAAP